MSFHFDRIKNLGEEIGAPTTFLPAVAGLQLAISFILIHQSSKKGHISPPKDLELYKVVRYENLRILMWSADCLLSADCLQNSNKPFRDF